MEIKCKKCGRESFSCSPIYEDIECVGCGGNDWIPKNEENISNASVKDKVNGGGHHTVQ